MDDLLRRLGQRIRELRTRNAWSQEEFADICRVHRTYMGHLERGEKNVSFRSLLRLTHALNVTLSELFAGLEGSQEDAPDASTRRLSAKANIGRSWVDRERLLKELANLERATGSLREAIKGPAKVGASLPGRASIRKRNPSAR